MTTNNNSALNKILAQAMESANRVKKGKTKSPKACAGGCGQMTKGGQWMPGHDGRMVGRLADLIRTGCTPDEARTVTDCSDDWDRTLALHAVAASRETAQLEAAEQTAAATA